MGTGQVTPFVNSQVPMEIPVGKIPNPHRILSQQHILQTFRTHLQTREFFLSASSPKSPVANMAIKSAAAPSKTPSLGPPMTPVKRNDPTKPPGSNTKFKFGQFKGKTFWEILHDHPDYFVWTQKNAKSPGASEYAEWVNQHFEYQGTVVYRRSGLEPPPPLPKQHTRLRKPPNPPKEKCAVCTQFTRQGSTGYTIKETCLVCGHATTTRREMIPQYPFKAFEECPHEDKDSRGSSRFDLFIEFSANSVARFWMRLRWSSKRPVRKFPTRFWTHHWKGRLQRSDP